MSDETSIARNDYQYFERSVAGIFAFQQKQRNRAFPGQSLEPSDFWIGVTHDGIFINGDYGTNPSIDEARELVEVMRECVAAFDALQEGGA